MSFAHRSTRWRSAWAPYVPTRRDSTLAGSRRRVASRAGSRSAAGRSPRDLSSNFARAGSPRSSRRSPPRGSSRSCSRAGRRWPRPSWRLISSTSCFSSWRPSWQEVEGPPSNPGYHLPGVSIFSRSSRWETTSCFRPMSTNRDFQRTDDEIVSLLSQWLMGAVGNDELRKRIEEIGTDELAPGQRTAVEELLVALGNAFPGERGDLERVIRETMEALAYGE